MLENMLGKNFDSLARRILYSYIAAYPEFVPASCKVSLDAQIEMHQFMKEVLLLLYQDPQILGITAEEDNCFENWQMNVSNPELMKAMEKIEGKFANYIELFLKIGKAGEVCENQLIIRKGQVPFSKVTKEKMERIGVSCSMVQEQIFFELPQYSHAVEAWSAYGKADDESATKIDRVIHFIYGKYFGRIYTATDFFAALFENPDLLQNLENDLKNRGFLCANELLNAKTRYAAVKWTKAYSKKETSSMSVHFDWRKKNQIMIEFRLWNFRTLLNTYEQMDESLQRFVFERLKTCDHCGYCTQMDKTGKRNCLAMTLSCAGETMNKCPLYPNLVWNQMNQDDLVNMMRLFELSER